MALVNFVPVMTSYTAPSGVVTTSDEYASFYAWKAFDGDTGTLWSDAYDYIAWIQYEFPVVKACSQYTITVGDATFTPKDFTLQASNTGSFTGEQVTLDTQTTVTWTLNEKKTFPFTNTTEYKYYRLDVTDKNSVDLRIHEIELMGIVTPKSTATISATTATSAFTGATSSPTASIITESKGKPFVRASASASITAVSTATRKQVEELFQLVGKIQIASIVRTHNLVGKIEQIPSSTIIKRVNI